MNILRMLLDRYEKRVELFEFLADSLGLIWGGGIALGERFRVTVSRLSLRLLVFCCICRTNIIVDSYSIDISYFYCAFYFYFCRKTISLIWVNRVSNTKYYLDKGEL